jgi:hypothetical protein
MFEAAVSGARTDEIEGVEVVVRPALTAAAVDVLELPAGRIWRPAGSLARCWRRRSPVSRK